MTNRQLLLVQQSWKLLREIDPALLGDVFYERLFIQYPSLRAMFKGPMENQYQKFIDTLSILVARLDRPEAVGKEINQLAQSHAGYGVKPEHYVAVKEALLWTLEQGLGQDWNEEVRQAWICCYDLLTSVMLAKKG
ncbi:globin family protein [Rhabdobacter roseus]|uniref:Hemoglobin-like flavoprotein n=1 Tax=Rhabdobacter roseus TaxID=1655419 RepID=A0A840TU39_9BACT|nr:globin domain-containing protein [Rhabdobacter roseus]MBB5283558.1 hemoglobin-like flavoprotein [Rhabdobacter roseus]